MLQARSGTHKPQVSPMYVYAAQHWQSLGVECNGLPPLRKWNFVYKRDLHIVSFDQNCLVLVIFGQPTCSCTDLPVPSRHIRHYLDMYSETTFQRCDSQIVIDASLVLMCQSCLIVLPSASGVLPAFVAWVDSCAFLLDL